MSVYNSIKEQNANLNRVHPNVLLLKQLDLCNLTDASDLFAQNFAWHFSNPKFPAIQGDYFGLEGLQSFFREIEALTDGSFTASPISATPMGDELIVAHIKDTVTMRGRPITIDAAVVWRIVKGRIAEAWVIPSGFTMAVSEVVDKISA